MRKISGFRNLLATTNIRFLRYLTQEHVLARSCNKREREGGGRERERGGAREGGREGGRDKERERERERGREREK